MMPKAISEHMDYDGCDFLSVGTKPKMWVSQCGFMVHDRIMRSALRGGQEERLSRAHQKHHAISIGRRVVA